MSKKIILIILIATLGASLLIATGAVTFAWYSSRVTSDNDLEIPAGGALIVGFDSEAVIVSGNMYPAVAMKDAIRDNKHVDVLIAYDESVEESLRSYVSTPATTFNYASDIHFYEDPTNKDAYSSYNCWFSVDSYVVNNGTKYDSIDDEVAYSMTITITYTDASLSEHDVENMPIYQNTPFSLLGECKMKLNLSVYYAKVDEECDPALIGGTLHLKLGSFVKPVSSGTVEE